METSAATGQNVYKLFENIGTSFAPPPFGFPLIYHLIHSMCIAANEVSTSDKLPAPRDHGSSRLFLGDIPFPQQKKDCAC